MSLEVLQFLRRVPRITISPMCSRSALILSGISNSGGCHWVASVCVSAAHPSLLFVALSQAFQRECVRFDPVARAAQQ